MRVRTLIILALISGCSRAPEPDAYGNVEATEVTVAAEVAGQLKALTAEEGKMLAAGDVVGTIDPTQLTIQRDQYAAQRTAAASRVDEVTQQIRAIEAQREAATAQRDAAQAQKAVLDSQLEIARRTFDRTRRLLEEKAATAQQMDQAEREVRTLENQITAQTQQVAAQGRQVDAYASQVAAARQQRRTASAQVGTAAAQVAQVEDRLGRSEVRNPSAGTVLARYAEPGEIVQIGQPLYKVADLSSVTVRAFVDGTQLAQARIGAEADVTFDVAADRRETARGTITWVASEAEFTPTPIQTRDERANLVYAIKLRVANPQGQLKIGMPVDVTFSNGQ